MAEEVGCKPCCVLLDDKEVAKFYCPKRDKYVVSLNNNKVDSPEEKPSSSKNISFQCQICRRNYGTCQSLYRHVYDAHKPARHCNSCRSLFLTKELFTKHLSACIQTNRKAKIYSCDYCSQTFQLKPNLIKHVNIEHTGKKNNVNESALLNIKLYTNITTKTESEFRSKLLVHCVSCGEDFKYEKFFLEHFQICSRNPTFVCPFCSMSKVHFNETVEHVGKHISLVHKFTDCAECTGKFFTDLNARIHASRMHKREIIKLNAPIHANKPRLKTNTMELPGFHFLDFLNISAVPSALSNEQTLEENQKVEEEEMEVEEPPSPEPNSLDQNPPTNLKTDIQRVISILEEKGMLEENVSVYCNTCKSAFCLETYTMHLVSCLKSSEFLCPFCEGSVGAELGTEDRWGHIKFHLVSLASSASPGGSLCVMCDEAFLTEYNMAIHAQFAHFL